MPSAQETAAASQAFNNLFVGKPTTASVPNPPANTTNSVPPAMAESIARSQGQTTLPNPTNVTPAQFMNPVPAANSVNPVNPNNNPAVNQNLTQAFNQIKDTPAPQNAGEATSAIDQAVKTANATAASAPTFYKPNPNSPQIFDAQGNPLSYEAYKAAGGVGVNGQPNWTDVVNGPVPASQGTPLTGIEQQLAADPGYQQLLKDYAEYNSIANQQKSLVDTYNDIVKSSGLEAINTELVNMKKVIDGTEDDIRNEVTAASGFATESQVMALAQARNKTLIKNYNALVDQQSNIVTQVNTMVNLSAQDRQFAMQSAMNKLNIDQQLNDYRQKFIANAQEGYKNYINAVGYSGLYNSLANDPQSLAVAEKTLGLPSGTIRQAAQMEAEAKAQAQAQQAFDNKIKQQQVNISAGNLALDRQKFAYQQQQDAAKTVATQGQLTQIGSQVDLANSILSDPRLSEAVGSNPLSRATNILGKILSPTYYPGSTTNFVSKVEQLRSQLNLQALENAKANGATFGALSDAELQVLASSATKLGSALVKDKSGNVIGYKLNEKDFRNEINKINNFAKLDYVLKGGDASQVGVQIQGDGKAFVKNYDGSITQIYP